MYNDTIPFSISSNMGYFLIKQLFICLCISRNLQILFNVFYLYSVNEFPFFHIIFLFWFSVVVIDSKCTVLLLTITDFR